jgi:thiol-disulfide isomerase/thioredoxin
MNTALRIIILLALITIGCNTQSNNDRQISKLLAKVEANNRRINSISYYTVFEQINPTINDSILKVEGTVWLQRNKTDSIFGSIFHVHGIDKYGSYDYFYDGTKSYEIRHKYKTVKIIDPYKYQNNANNPAKARTALSPLINELTDIGLLKSLQKNNPLKSLVSSKDCYVIKFIYPTDEYGQELTKYISIDNKSYKLVSIKKKVLFQGFVYTETYNVDSIQFNLSEIIDNIYLQTSYPDYAVSELNRDSKVQNNSSLIGLRAKNFKYPTFNNDTINLSSLSGKYVLLDFWETYCGHCLLALPEIQKIQDKYQDRLVVIGITSENREQVKKLLQKNSITYLNVFADQKIINDYSVQGRPTYFLIDRNGIIIDNSLDLLDNKLK